MGTKIQWDHVENATSNIMESEDVFYLNNWILIKNSHTVLWKNEDDGNEIAWFQIKR